MTTVNPYINGYNDMYAWASQDCQGDEPELPTGMTQAMEADWLRGAEDAMRDYAKRNFAVELSSKIYTQSYTDTVAWLAADGLQSKIPTCPDEYTPEENLQWLAGHTAAIGDHHDRVTHTSEAFDEGYEAASVRYKAVTLENPVCPKIDSQEMADWWAGYQAGLDELKAEDEAHDRMSARIADFILMTWYYSKVLLCIYGAYHFIKNIYSWIVS